MITPPQTLDRLLRVRGTVQGVGFRPFVARRALALGLRGWVRNDTDGVQVRALGRADELEHFAAELHTTPPPAAKVTSVEWANSTAELPPVGDAFVILESPAANPVVTTDIPVDLAPCAECRRELADAADRRQGYIFINCTQCGPRYSIIESLPYDRPRTTMRAFQMCPECHREYTDPTDRRFHAEPNACPVCGPQLQLTDASGTELARGLAAIDQAADALRKGQVVAGKGVGGFHLFVNARDEAAVAMLRQRKHRDQKPFAVMFADRLMLEQWAVVGPEAAARLESMAAPIVLVQHREDHPLAPNVAPGNPWLGTLLPPSPFHIGLLAAFGGPLVATSGNLAEEPLCTDDEQARQRLAGIADLFLGHNRPIARPIDDSVVRFTASNRPIMLRRARGYAPTSFTLPRPLAAPTLCVGGHLKATVAVAAGRRVVVSPHIGDLGGSATQAVFVRSIDALRRVLATDIRAVACDLHPDYASTRFAEQSGLPLIPVQHHLAHVLAVLLEHGEEPNNVLGVAWDGTGYGEDGTIWGGEFILLHEGRAHRFGRLRPFRLPGGDAAVRDPRRVALALAVAAETGGIAAFGQRLGLKPHETATLQIMLERGLNAPICSSIGRLFDAFGATLGLSQRNAFEGQTPLLVEIAATSATSSIDGLPLPIVPASSGATWEIDWRPAFAMAMNRQAASPAALAAALHRGLARAIVDLAERAGVGRVVLSGGCFQNALLLDATEKALAARHFEVLTAKTLPPNDGAIAAGQALGALWNLTRVEPPPTQTGLVAQPACPSSAIVSERSNR